MKLLVFFSPFFALPVYLLFSQHLFQLELYLLVLRRREIPRLFQLFVFIAELLHFPLHLLQSFEIVQDLNPALLQFALQLLDCYFVAVLFAFLFFDLANAFLLPLGNSSLQLFLGVLQGYIFLLIESEGLLHLLQFCLGLDLARIQLLNLLLGFVSEVFLLDFLLREQFLEVFLVEQALPFLPLYLLNFLDCHRKPLLQFLDFLILHSVSLI